MDYLPLAFKLEGEPVLLVGAGVVAARKARLLKRAGAHLKVVATKISPEMRDLLDEHDICLERGFVDDDCRDVRLIVAATNSSALHEAMYTLARRRNVPINVVDSPDLCTFIFPAIVDRNPLVIGISSSGQSPVLARLIRKRLESWLPSSYGALARFLGSIRDKVKARLDTENQRRVFYEELVESAAAEAVLNGDDSAAQSLTDELLNHYGLKRLGEVALIGAGPGDPDLLTFKALRLLQRGDVVLYDRLVSPQILELARRDAELIYVGKARDQHALPQDQINQTLLDLAEQGLKVVRLKGGDPFIFGRGGEELELLAERGIPFQVVPGITSAAGAASYAGIPLTHRDFAQSVRFLPGYLKQGEAVSELDDTSVEETLVIYMGLKALPSVVERLLKSGRAASTAIALIENATLPDQRVLIADLETIVSKAKEREWIGPTLIIVGEVIRLHQRLGWYNTPERKAIT
jgi:uroporphyrin-III C-methyltransferase/precorrin-2 dehydrogenase/sirohydrochlorin ferrochelatase